MYRRQRKIKWIIFLILLVGALIVKYNEEHNLKSLESNVSDVFSIPDYSDKPYIIINNNEPDFDDLSHSTESFEVYSELDSLGRCGVAYANIGKDLMPTSKRDNISMIKPSGWRVVKYDFIEDGKYLYNRCHLIAYQLTAENANPKNLITCTRYMNTIGMQSFEDKVANYIRKTSNHVLYRVTPVFEGTNPLVKGVQMEALSIEDNGKGIKFNIFVYNIQPGVIIDYKTSDSYLVD